MSAQSFEFFVAARYLRAKRKQAVISVITVISVAGVAAGVARARGLPRPGESLTF